MYSNAIAGMYDCLLASRLTFFNGAINRKDSSEQCEDESKQSNQTALGTPMAFVCLSFVILVRMTAPNQQSLLYSCLCCERRTGGLSFANSKTKRATVTQAKSDLCLQEQT